MVIFTSTDDSLALPDPRYLKLHASVCRVAHKPGAAEYLNPYDWEQEERGVMAHDGTSAEYLMVKLNRFLHGRPLLLLLDDIFTDFISCYTDGFKPTEPQMKSASKFLSIPGQKHQEPNNS